MKTAAVAGIDEVGLGPTLGPLVLGAVLFRGPSACLGDLFSELKGFVRRTPSIRRDRLPIDDSKRLFAGRRSLAPLELPALATMRPRQPLATRLEELLEAAASGWPPWYLHAGACDLPCEVQPELVAEWRARWPAELASRGIEHVASFVRPVLEGELNDCFRRGLNKSEAVLTRLAPVLRRLATLTPDEELTLLVDRQGGRHYYGDFLLTVFPLRRLRVIEETERCSTYVLDDGRRTITVCFEVEGDGLHLPVALASVGAKYVRELFLRRFNAHFGGRKPGLKPTAGYHEDAWRWLADAADVLTAEERVALVRER